VFAELHHGSRGSMPKVHCTLRPGLGHPQVQLGDDGFHLQGPTEAAHAPMFDAGTDLVDGGVVVQLDPEIDLGSIRLAPDPSAFEQGMLVGWRLEVAATRLPSRSEQPFASRSTVKSPRKLSGQDGVIWDFRRRRPHGPSVRLTIRPLTRRPRPGPLAEYRHGGLIR
jgi:hypothetical protein